MFYLSLGYHEKNTTYDNMHVHNLFLGPNIYRAVLVTKFCNNVFVKGRRIRCQTCADVSIRTAAKLVVRQGRLHKPNFAASGRTPCNNA